MGRFSITGANSNNCNRQCQMYKYCLVFLVAVLCSVSVAAQCPLGKELWRRIVYLRDSSSIPPAQQLAELSERLEQIKNCPDPFDSSYTLLLQRIGWLKAVQKDFIGAITYTRKSISTVYGHEHKPGINRKYLVKSYNNLRVLYDSLKVALAEAEATDSCISVALSLNTGYEYAVPLIYLRTQRLFETGDYYRCINYALTGEKLARLYNQPETVFLYLIWRINSLIFLKRTDEAGLLLSTAIKEARANGYKKYLGAFYGFMANLAEERKDIKMALYYAAIAISYDKKNKNFDGCSATLNNLGFKLYFQQLQQYDAALLYFKQALGYASPASALNILDNIANVYVKKAVEDSALYYFKRSFNMIRKDADEQALLKAYQNGTLDKSIAVYIFDLIVDKGDAYQQRYRRQKNNEDLKTAIYIYRIADKLLNEIKTGQSAIESKLFWRKETRRLYEHAIAAAYQAHNSAESFYFFERSRAILLQDQLSEISNASNDDMLQEAVIKKRITQLENQQADSSLSMASSAALQGDLIENRQSLDRMHTLLKQHNSFYYQSFFDTSMVSLKTLQEDLTSAKTSLLELFEGDSAVYTLLVTKNHTYFNSIEKKDYVRTVGAYTTYLSDLSLLNRGFNEFADAARHLYKLIFVNDSLPDGRIIISPDGHYFPFESLVTAFSAWPDYFLNHHAVSYTYSMRYLQNEFALASSDRSTDFIGIAPLNFPAELRLSPLDGSSASLGTICRYFNGSTALVSENATRMNFQKNFADYKIIQLYTHASDSSMRKEPVIYFSDSALYLSELIPEKKPATQLIVLSACETGKGTLYQGEGVFSFNRAFAALGVPSSITNLWSIDNVSTYKLTELFYKYLSLGLPLDIALQKAKLEYIRNAHGENQLPYYWAAPILVGKTGPILLQQGFSWKYILVGIAICGLLIVAWKKIKQSKTFNPVQDTVQTGP
jgi:CHAT domain-containing protein